MKFVGRIDPTLFAFCERELHVVRLHCRGHEIAEARTIWRRRPGARLGSNGYRVRKHHSRGQGGAPKGGMATSHSSVANHAEPRAHATRAPPSNCRATP